jgi:hypothetical protein
MCTATIVVSLPALKALIVSATPTNTSKRSTSGYINAGSGKLVSNHGTLKSPVQGGKISDDELELVLQVSRRPSPSFSRTTSATATQNP